MKIKTKKQLNLPQLIKWAWDNGIDSRTFIDPEGGDITFDEYGDVVNVYSINHNDTFTVEVEEEIDEDTELDLIERFVGGMGYSCYTTHRMTIKDCLRRSPEECTTTHFYIENDNRELVLIWREGKLVD